MMLIIMAVQVTWNTLDQTQNPMPSIHTLKLNNQMKPFFFFFQISIECSI